MIALEYILYIYIIVVIVTYLTFKQYRMSHGCALILALIIGQIILNILKPPHDLDDEHQCMNSTVAFYTLIQLLTPIIVYLYVIYMCINNCNRSDTCCARRNICCIPKNICCKK